MIKKLRVKFICINMAIVTAMLCIIFGLILHFTQKNLESESIRMMQTVAMAPMQPGHPDNKPPDMHLPYFTVQVNPQGKLTASGDSFYDLSDDTFLQMLVDNAFASKEETGTIPEYGLRFCHANAPDGRCLVFADISSERSTIRGLFRTCLLIGAGSFFLFLAVSFLLARWAVKPVEAAWTQQRQFVADASHELKTPLTVIMTNAEMLQDEGYDECSRSQLLGNVLTMSRQMRGLVESLLELARVDNGAAKTNATLLDFSKLVSDSLLPFEPIYYEKGLRLNSRIEPDILLKGSEAHLRQVIEILLDNAQKYASSEAEIIVSLQKQGKNRCLLSVSNPGEPISPEDLKNIFKRFYRIDKVRSMDHSYGLGLSIAESIIREHHGRIWAESSDGLNTFYVGLGL